MEARQFLIVGGSALAAFVVGRLTSASGERGDDVTRQAVASDAAVPETLTASLARIESRLDALSLADAPARVERAPIEGPQPANAADLDEWVALSNDLRAAIDALGAQARSVAVTSFEAAPSNASWRAVLASAPPFDQEVLRSFLVENDYPGLRRQQVSTQLMFTSIAEIVSRIGLPTKDVKRSGERWTLSYECDLPEPFDATRFINCVYFTFFNGHLAEVNIGYDYVDER